MNNHFCCPQCGQKKLQVTTESNTQTSGKNYSGGQGCLGYLLFGPLGLLCGLCGQGQTTTTTHTTFWYCPDCGHKFEHPDSLRKKINSYNTPIFPVMSVIGGIFALIFLFMFMEADAGVAFFLALLTAGIFVGLGFLVKKWNDAQKEKLESQLYELERKMKKHYE